MWRDAIHIPSLVAAFCTCLSHACGAFIPVQRLQLTWDKINQRRNTKSTDLRKHRKAATAWRNKPAKLAKLQSTHLTIFQEYEIRAIACPCLFPVPHLWYTLSLCHYARSLPTYHPPSRRHHHCITRCRRRSNGEYVSPRFTFQYAE